MLDSLFQMKEALKESLHRQWELEESRREQIAALAHDIKTPLTVIRGNAELLAEGELAEEEKEYDRDILQSVEIMEGYLGMLHELLQADRNGIEAGNRRIPCEALAGKMEQQARLLASARKCKVIFDREELQGEVQGNESQMIRAFQNIVSNALDHSPPAKALRIRISHREEQGEM
ncbi:histidine kinase dimerization/phospho-acceptor domain-containing protein, partial [Schaedlerella sp.]|uniref:histidine kinase dimerization/phospho-acceptor domain-containing protein n=1 Tax=Schaedlerella sp. TaxID=2676057 RepID=UPI0035286963